VPDDDPDPVDAADPADRPIIFEQHNEVARGASLYAVLHGDIHIRNGWPVYRIEPFPASPRPVSHERAARQPSVLLAADSQVVDFAGRSEELDELVRWRDSPAPGVSVMLVHGPGGQGKTRLAARFAADSAVGGWTVWAAHHLSDPTAATAVAPGDGGQSLLVVVEYAERWPADDLQLLIQNPILRRPYRSRVLLVTRPSGPWWPALRHRLRKADIDVGGTLALAPLARSPQERAQLFFSAAESFAGVLGASASGLRLPEIRASDEDSYQLVLTVHMAALVAVDARVRDLDPPSDPIGLSAYLLDREHDCWQSQHDHVAAFTAPAVMSRTVFAATMTRPLSRPVARAAMARIGVLAGEAAGGHRETVERVLDDHAACYPPPEGSADVLIPLYPDRLGEDFIALSTPGHEQTDYQPDAWTPAAAVRLLSPADQPATAGAADPAVWVRPAAAVLIQTAVRWPHVARLLEIILRHRPELAQSAGGAALANLAEIDDLDLDVLRLVESRFPRHEAVELAPGMAAVARRLTHELLPATEDLADRARLLGRLRYRLSAAGLRDEALAAMLESAALRRQLAAGGSVEAQEDLAFALFSLGADLYEAGRRREAAPVAQEAVEAYRSLAAGPGPVPPVMAHSLVNLGVMLDDVGKRGQALDVTEEAVAALRPLAGADLVDFGPGLARALTNLSGYRMRAGQHAAAVAAARESVQIRESLVAHDAARFEHQLAGALNNLAVTLGATGEAAEAATVLTRAATVLRRLASSNPDAIVPDLANALINLAGQHRDLGSWVDGLVAAQEAVSLLEPQAAHNPARFEPQLAIALTNQSVLLSNLGRKQDALAVSTRVCAVTTRLVLVDPTRFVPDMASAWALRSAALNAVGRHQEALEELEKALRVWRRLADTDPAAHEPELARSLRNLGVLLATLGQEQEALATAQEANALWTKLSVGSPRTFDLDLGRSLERLSWRLTDAGRPAEALAPAERAVAVFRLLAARSERFLPELAGSLSSLGKVLSELRRRPDALTVSREAVAVWDRLPAGAPEPFQPELARSLEYLLVDLAHNNQLRQPEALSAARRLVAIRRRQAADDPTRQPDLVDALQLLVGVLKKSGRRREAWAVAREVGREVSQEFGRQIDREVDRLLAKRGRSDAPRVSSPPADARAARTLTKRGDELAKAGRKTEALQAYEDATEMWRTLAEGNPLCRSDLAQCLLQTAGLLGETGSPELAVAAGDQAVAIYRDLAPEYPEEYEPQLARSLIMTAWSRLLSGAGRQPPCLAELAEAAEIYGRLATAQPGTYTGPLSTVQSLLSDLREIPGNNVGSV
jgi:tetratricopeptide (TPR) repeat protein